jgi:hypothetical protein
MKALCLQSVGFSLSTSGIKPTAPKGRCATTAHGPAPTLASSAAGAGGRTRFLTLSGAHGASWPADIVTGAVFLKKGKRAALAKLPFLQMLD